MNSIINYYTDTEQIDGLLLLVDFEKAFHSIEWPFIEKPYFPITFNFESPKLNGWSFFMLI